MIVQLLTSIRRLLSSPGTHASWSAGRSAPPGAGSEPEAILPLAITMNAALAGPFGVFIAAKSCKSKDIET